MRTASSRRPGEWLKRPSRGCVGLSSGGSSQGTFMLSTYPHRSVATSPVFLALSPSVNSHYLRGSTMNYHLLKRSCYSNHHKGKESVTNYPPLSPVTPSHKNLCSSKTAYLPLSKQGFASSSVLSPETNPPSVGPVYGNPGYPISFQEKKNVFTYSITYTIIIAYTIIIVHAFCIFQWVYGLPHSTSVNPIRILILHVKILPYYPSILKLFSEKYVPMWESPN